jgi:lipopolysaccharide transport system ATP-binding protein
MSSSASIRIRDVSKVYRTYARPVDRLKQAAMARIQGMTRLVGRQSRAPEYFNEFWALSNVSFDVEAGQCLGILGRNGAGKSTLLQVIAGTVIPTTGEVAASGRIGALLELGSGFNSEFTGRENVYLSAALLGLSRKETEAKLPLIEEFAEIGAFIDQPIKTYSSGMVLRLAFSVYVALDPSIMIVDEAMAVGDARFQRKCYRRLNDFKSRGGTILFVTHDMGLVAQICDRAMVLENGRVFADGPPERVIREYHRLLFGPADGESIGAPKPQVGAALEPLRKRSEREVRYGSSEATIVDIFARGAEGSTQGPFQMNAEYEFVMCVQYHSAIKTPLNYGFILSNVQGIEIYGVTSSLFARRLPAAPAGTQFECMLRMRMSLAPGIYFLSGAIAHADARDKDQFLDYRFDAMQLQVVGQPRCFSTSVVDLGGDLHERMLTTASTGQ